MAFISDDYIHTLIPYIEAEGFESPPYTITLKECQIVGDKYFINRSE